MARRSGSLKGLAPSAGSPSEASMEAASLIAGRLDELGARMADRADVIAILARLQVLGPTCSSSDTNIGCCSDICVCRDVSSMQCVLPVGFSRAVCACACLPGMRLLG